MYGDHEVEYERKPYGLMVLLLLSMVTLAGVAYWKMAKPASGPMAP